MTKTKSEPQAHHLTVARTARYYTLGTPGPHIKTLWITCHGYGQLAGQFIRKFEAVLDEETLVVAPEGLSRFYWEGVSGDVGASWMTKDDRLAEIDDYVAYLSSLYDFFVTQLPPQTRIVLAGFSQGCATQLRWITRQLPHFDVLLLWAGGLPEDIDYKPLLPYFQEKSLHFVYGLQDQYLTEERIATQSQWLADTGLPLQIHTFDGKHEIDREVLRQWAKEGV
ncbi:MAG: phospholipase [Saprospiraceae bacterium]|nr:phospholipase [Saprospiraceae bacterium]